MSDDGQKNIEDEFGSQIGNNAPPQLRLYIFCVPDDDDWFPSAFVPHYDENDVAWLERVATLMGIPENFTKEKPPDIQP